MHPWRRWRTQTLPLRPIVNAIKKLMAENEQKGLYKAKGLCYNICSPDYELRPVSLQVTLTDGRNRIQRTYTS